MNEVNPKNCTNAQTLKADNCERICNEHFFDTKKVKNREDGRFKLNRLSVSICLHKVYVNKIEMRMIG